MKPAIKNFRFYFVKAMALKLVQPEDQYESDLKSYWYLLKLKRQVSMYCSTPWSIWLEKHVQGVVLVDVDPVWHKGKHYVSISLPFKFKDHLTY